MALPNIVEAHLITPKNSNNSLRPRAATAMEIRPRRHIAELHRRNESTPIANVSKIHISRPNHRTAKLKHEAGESAMHCQDRSKRRRSLLGTGDRTSKTFAVEKTKFSQLPVGYTLPDAKSQFNSSDVEKLRKQAKTQAEKFKVLQYHEVKSLSKVSQSQRPSLEQDADSHMIGASIPRCTLRLSPNYEQSTSGRTQPPPRTSDSSPPLLPISQ